MDGGDERIQDLAALAANGDEESFVALCGVMKTRLFRVAKGILGDDALALEAVSEAVFRAYKGIRRLRKPEYAATWFTRILINAANDAYRQRKREAPLDAVQERTHYDKHDDMDFGDMIGGLAPELREIVSLKYYSEYTLEEISLMLKIPLGTVKSRLNRALKQLRLEAAE
jgi:RNA polymerase sigma-70 factor (ECF subfamily)